MQNNKPWLSKLMFLLMVLLFVICQAVLAASSPTEDISKIGAGARPMGMGKAFVAVADDINSLFLNPAGLGEATKFQFTSMYTSLFEGDLNYVVFAASNPFAFGSLGFGFISTGTGQIPSPTASSITYFDYYDRLFILSLATKEPVLLGNDLLRAGINLKYFSKGFSDAANSHGAGVDADLGIKLTFKNGISLAANAQNFLGSGMVWNTGAVDDIPAVLKIGMSGFILDRLLLLAADCDIPLSSNMPLPLHAGLEYRMNQYLTMRAGLEQVLSASSSVSTNATAGIGLCLSSFRFDYSYHPYRENGISAAHFISFTVL